MGRQTGTVYQVLYVHLKDGDVLLQHCDVTRTSQLRLTKREIKKEESIQLLS